jgi:hypothetical protein
VPGGSSFVFGRMKPRTTIRSILRHSDGFEPGRERRRRGAAARRPRQRGHVLGVNDGRASST